MSSALLLPSPSSYGASESIRYEVLDLKGVTSENFPVADCKRAIESLRRVPHPGLDFIWKTFGTEARCVKRFTSRFRGREHILVVDLMNETCRKYPGRCESQEMEPQMTTAEFNRAIVSGILDREILGRAKEVLDWVNGVRNDKTRVVLVLGTEDRFTEDAVVHILQLLSFVWPFEFGYNPERPSDLVGTFVRVLHSEDPNCRRGQFVSLDGFDVGVRKARDLLRADRKLGCGAFSLWKGRWQGRPGGAYVVPRRRIPVFTVADQRYVEAVFR